MTAARAVEILEQEKMNALKTRTPYNPDAKEKIEAYNMAIEELIADHTIPLSYVSVDRVLDIVHKTVLEFFDSDNEERPMNDKEKLLLSVNKAICNNLKSLKGGEQNV